MLRTSVIWRLLVLPAVRLFPANSLRLSLATDVVLEDFRSGVRFSHAAFTNAVKSGCGSQRFRFVFRMELARDEIRMCFTRQLDHLDELAVGRNAAENQALPFRAARETQD